MWNDFEICSTEDVTLTDVYCTNGVFRVKCREQVRNRSVTSYVQS